MVARRPGDTGLWGEKFVPETHVPTSNKKWGMELRENVRKQMVFSCLCAFGVTTGLMFMLYLLKGYAPFGESSLACMDGNIQYLDFFSYLKRVLAGETQVLYTMEKTFGGSCLAVFSYYLTSPLNLLVVFFSQEQLHAFFDVVVALKLGLASASCCYFIHRRFSQAANAGVGVRIMVVLLSAGYGLSHYTLTQASNIMWLDAVYCLPLMLLGVHRVVRGQRGISLAVWTAYAIVCNWYAGAINCIFACIWWVWETVAWYWEEQPRPAPVQAVQRTVRSGLHYAYLMGAGVLISCVLFVPTARLLQNSSRGSLELGKLLDVSFVGELPSVVQNQVVGVTASLGNASLFCGGLALLGCTACLLERKVTWQKRLSYGGLLLLAVLLLYWNPFYVIFSLFKDVGSYWYRYSYVCIFVVVFLAAEYFLCHAQRSSPAWLAKVGAGLSASLVILFYLHQGQSLKYTYISALALCAGAGAVSVWYGGKRRRVRVLALVLAATVFGVELGYNAHAQMNRYHTADVAVYQSYVTQQRQQLHQLQQQDDGTYRISQTDTRNKKPNGLTAYYNDALAFGYWSISGYTSSPDDVQREFLDAMGYPISGANMCIVNTSILAADALLGVKYVLSPYAINGLELKEELGAQNGKKVYENPYVLPMAFVFEGGGQEPQRSADPFQYQNQLYSQLMGETVQLYLPLEYTADEATQGQREYAIELPQGNYVLYGNFPWSKPYTTQVELNNSLSTAYACFLSPSVLYVPTQKGDTQATVTLTASDLAHITPGSAQFYALDLDELQRVTQTLGQAAASSCQIDNGTVRVEAEAQGEGQKLYLSIPYDKGWTVKRNGEIVEPELLGECMYVIPLVDGENTIEMNYQVPGLKAGAGLTLVGVALLAGYWMVTRRKNHA